MARPALAGQAPEFVGPSEPAPAAAQEQGILPYRTVVEGVEEGELRTLLEGSSQLIALGEKPPATIAGLRRRAEGDIQRLTAALHSEGYYQPAVDLEIDSEVRPTQVTLRITPGPRYTLQAYDITFDGNPPPAEAEQPRLDEIGIALGMPARAPVVVGAEQSLVSLLQERGYPFAQVRERKTFVNHEKTEMTVRLAIDAGPAAVFGPLSFKGQEEVEADYLHRISEWPQGEPYDRRVVRNLQRRLAATGLFSSANAETAAQPTPDGSLPVTVTLVEREQRSIGGVVNYSSDVGPGAEIFWEHRNLLGRNEKLRVSAIGSLIEQSGDISFRKPAFLQADQDLLADLSGGFEDNDAYERQAVDGLIALERPLFENWRVTGGISLGYEIVDEGADNGEGERQFTLLGLPVTAARDTRDDLLDPASGSRLHFSLTPFTGAGDDTLLFLTAIAGGSAYYALDSDERFILAGRARAGTILGEKNDALPASSRFYAGGGGSVRGYEYQLVGPLDDDQDPFGGTSLLELGGEVRVRVTDEIGIVPFVDGGTVYDEPYFNSGETLRWAAGLGLRYFTGFGPLRLDVAFPLNPRDGVDEAFQFYVSFGQAF
ncbi:autotransporter assembly complex family protein [Pelagibius sp. CAU 1746]|uniref:autotransporter assembly complex protein TamA n=1 Tax=Pelagibius sp. CAU 1746 TaxID=3140370 RepID=UPI00325B0F9A